MCDEHSTEPREAAAAHWESRYAERERIWSGQPNVALVASVADLAPGRALDLGCGEGADAVWLAGRGWRVTAVDVSATAIERARALAASRRTPEGRIDWVVTDLDEWYPAGEFELVSACFLHSDATLDRVAVLRRAAGAVAGGGHLLVLAHAHPPPWAAAHEHATSMFLGPDDELAGLGLDRAQWDIRVSEIRERTVRREDIGEAVLEDSVLLLRRH